MYGNGPGRLLLHILMLLNLKEMSISVVVEVGGMKVKIVECHSDMLHTAPRKQAV
jgi:hypothetical protein